MQNFVLETPTKILFGRDTIGQIGAEARAFGRTALLVTGQKSLQASGLLEQIGTSLTASGIRLIHHSGVKSNPILSHVRQGICPLQGPCCRSDRRVWRRQRH